MTRLATDCFPLLRLLALFAAAVLPAMSASAQVAWESLPAAEFAAETKSFLGMQPPPSAKDEQFVTQLAWSRFLADKSFIASGDLDALTALVNLFAKRRSLAVGEAFTAEQIEERFVALRTQLSERLLGDSETLKGRSLYEVNNLAKSLGMADVGSTEKAELFVAWMATSDWRSLPLTDRYNLYSFVNVDAVDRRHFSARWTGSLTAPAAGAYTLRQTPQYAGTDSRVKVYVGEQLVLDSTDKTLGEARFESQPVELAAGEAVSLRVEMVHDVSRIDWSEGAPMVVLTWEADRIPQQIIPSTAFALPEGFGKAGTRGLKGEYFADLAHQDLKVTRLDAALDLVSSWPPAAPAYHEQADAALRTCVDDMLNDAVLAEAAAEGNEAFFHYSLWRIAYRMTATERVKLVEALVRTPEAIAIMTPEAMGRLMQAVYMLPGKEHLTLFGEWASIRPQPRCKAGEFPGWGVDKYQYNNLDFYWLMGLFWQRSYWHDMETLWDEYLVRENGDCNLPVAYATAFACRESGQGHLILQKIDEQINDPSLSGDQQATWYIARAFVKEILPARPRPLAGYDDLKGAALVAESEDYSFWALQEMTARLISVGQSKRAEALIEQRQGDFATPMQRQAIAAWSAKADALDAVYAKKRQDTVESVQKSYLAELKRRRELASGRGDDEAVAGYEADIASFEEQLEK